jgi:hypothetical protein
METLNKLDYNGILTRILDIKMAIRREEREEEITTKYEETMKGIEIIEDAIQRRDWYEQMEELKRFYTDISGKMITIETPEIRIPEPENIRQTLFSHEDKPENVEVIREEQDARELHQEIHERLKKMDRDGTGEKDGKRKTKRDKENSTRK